MQLICGKATGVSLEIMPACFRILASAMITTPEAYLAAAIRVREDVEGLLSVRFDNDLCNRCPHRAGCEVLYRSSGALAVEEWVGEGLWINSEQGIEVIASILRVAATSDPWKVKDDLFSEQLSQRGVSGNWLTKDGLPIFRDWLIADDFSRLSAGVRHCFPCDSETWELRLLEKVQSVCVPFGVECEDHLHKTREDNERLIRFFDSNTDRLSRMRFPEVVITAANHVAETYRHLCSREISSYLPAVGAEHQEPNVMTRTRAKRQELRQEMQVVRNQISSLDRDQK